VSLVVRWTIADKLWYKSFFGEDYFEIYEGLLAPEETTAQVEGIISLLELRPGARVLDVACGHGRHAIPLAFHRRRPSLKHAQR